MTVETVKGTATLAKKVWYFIQSTSAPVGSSAVLPAMQTEGGVSLEGDSIDEQTKFGRVVMPSTNSDSIELTTYVVPEDQAIEIITQAKHNGDQVKVWRVVVDKRYATKTGTAPNQKQVFPAMFGYAVVDSVSLDDGDKLITAKYKLNIIDKLKEGQFELTDAEIATLDAVYEYENPGDKTGNFGEDAPTV